MKRSEINNLMRSAQEFLVAHQFYLPPFAAWTPAHWQALGPEASELIESQLGWDITDFGSDDFDKCGLLLFTLRNGRSTSLPHFQGKTYAEKVMIIEVAQVTPLHFHWQKTEDIINRGGGNLVVQLYHATPDDELAAEEITFNMDGITRQVSAGGTVILTPGESITLPPRLYHAFWGEGRRVLVGEVFKLNDDRTDNRFHQPIGRFPKIVEDEPPLHLLTVDYSNFFQPKSKP